MICGLTDANSMFHPLASLICNQEDIETYNYLFAELLGIFNDRIKTPLNICCTMSDCGPAVLTALEANFPDVLHKLCWYHVFKRLRLKIPEKSTIASQFYKNMNFLNTMTNKNQFDKCIALFKQSNAEICTTE